MRVLYICTGNSFRSVVAEALTRRFRSNLEVESAGTHPADHVAENAKELLSYEDAEQYVKPSPDMVSQRAIDDADKIVVMDPEHRDYLEENFDLEDKDIEVWHVHDPIEPDIEPMESFIKIREKLRALDPYFQ